MLTYKNPKAKACAVCERVFVPERDGEDVCSSVCGLKRARSATSSVLKIELPWPDPKLAPNRRNGKHWTATHAAKGKRLADARLLTLQAMRQAGYVPPAGTLAMVLTFHAPDKRRRDLDNLLAAMKADFDGISQALGVDDQLFEPLTLRRGGLVSGGAVVLEVGC